jgi:hypothetical protein
MKESIIPRSIALAITIVVGIVLNYLFLPAWNLQSGGMYAFLFVMACIAFATFAIADSISYDENRICTIITLVFAGIVLLAIIIGVITSAQLFHASRYQSLIEIEEGNFTEEIASNNIDEIAVVDVATAERLGDRTLANLSNPSWYEVDNEYNLILYNGTQYRLSPINYGGFFKYMKAKSTGIPGYVLVNACTQEAQVVTLEESIMYSPSAYFSYDLTRHLRNQYPSYVFGKSFFEIDDEGMPYWITSVKTTNIGIWGGKTETSFIITDAHSGKSEEYEVSELPSWVDHAFDLDYLMDMVYYNYEYINGFINFSKTDVNRTSYYYKDSGFTGYNTTLSSDGVVFYTGVTPANAAESSIGFLLANPRTGVVKYYSCSGAEESSAQAAAQGLVQNLGYIATFPTIVNIDGLPTYFMVLKDNAGLIQRYAFSNVANYSITVQAPTIEEALALYHAEFGITDEVEEEPIQTVTTTGVIDFLSTAEIDGNTYFYFTLEEDENLYMSSIKNSSKQVLLTVGTTVTVEFVSTAEESTMEVTKINF